MERPDAYEVLGVSPRADLATLRKAYRALARRYHPDGAEPDSARMVEINAAYEQVDSVQRRAAYDRRRQDAVSLHTRGQTDPCAGAPSAPTSAAVTRQDPTPPTRMGPLMRRKAAAEHGEPPIIDFGRYAGWAVGEVAHFDPEYLRWLSRHSSGVRFQMAIRQALPHDPQVGRRGAFLR